MAGMSNLWSWVSTQTASRGPRVGALPLEQPVGPVDHDLVGLGEPAAGGEHLAGVAHRHPVAEHLGHLDQRLGEVDGAEDQHAGRRGERLDEHRDGLLAGLAVLAVVAHDRRAGGQLAERVAADDPVEVGVAERAERLAIGPDQQLGADGRALDHGDQRDRLLGPQGLVEGVEDRRHASGYQSSGSMKRWMVPPQVRPTANASSSL